MGGESGKPGGQGVNGADIAVFGLGALSLSLIAGVLGVALILGVVVECALGVIFWPLVILCKIHFLHCGGDGGGASVDGDKVVAAYRSDGRGELNTGGVPADLLRPIQDAGALCTRIGPIVIAAQIQQASGFDTQLKGPDGAEGVSQLPPDRFKEFGEDDDGNGDVSALDPEDSVMAQGRYMCSLAKDVDTLLADQQVEGDALDLTLAAYKVGLDAVKQAKGVPENTPAGVYIVGVRSGFALFSDAVGLPDGQTDPSYSPLPLGDQ